MAIQDGDRPMPKTPTRCAMGKATDFEVRHGVMETRAMTFFGWSWANRGKTQSICNACGYIHAFADPR